MRHQAGDIAALVADAGDVLQRAVRIRPVRHVAGGIAVLPEDLVPGLESGQGFLIRKITAFAVGDGHAQHLARRNPARKRRIRS